MLAISSFANISVIRGQRFLRVFSRVSRAIFLLLPGIRERYITLPYLRPNTEAIH